MARIRTIKPDFWTDEKIANLKRDVRLLFIGLWNLADDAGVLKASPAFIKGQLFSYDEDLRLNTVKEWLDALQDARMLIPFTHNAESYYVIRTFKSHQTINRPTPSKVPQNVAVKLLTEYSVSIHGISHDDSQQEIEGKGKEIEGNGYVRDEDLEISILNFFGFNEVANFDKLRKISEFCAALNFAGRLDYFRTQFQAYVDLKTLNRSFVHSFSKFLGEQSKRFEDGAWNSENWEMKLNEEKTKSTNQVNGGQNKSSRGVAAAMEWGEVKRIV